MCVKCGTVFYPIEWTGWNIKYLSTKDVYICEDCNPEFKKVVQEERIKRSLYYIDMKQIRSKKSKISILSFVNLIILLAVGLPLINMYFPIIILSTVEVFLIIK